MKRQFAAWLLAILVSGRLAADTIVWTNKTGGSYSTAACWNPNQVPKAGDLAELRATTAYTITLNGPATNHSLRVYNGFPTIDLHGNDYRLTNMTDISSSAVGFFVENAYLRVTNSLPTPAVFGSNALTHAVMLMPYGRPAGTIEFSGTSTVVRLRRMVLEATTHKVRILGGAKVTANGTTFSLRGSALFSDPGTKIGLLASFFGYGGTAVVSNGAIVTSSGTLELGRPGIGRAIVTGTGSTWTATSIYLATSDNATYGALTVTNGGNVVATAAIMGPLTHNRQGDMIVSGPGSVARAQDLFLSGSSRTVTFTNNPFRLRIADKAELQVTRYTTIWTNGTLTVDGGIFKPSTQGVVNRGRLEGRGRLERHDASGTVLWDNYGTIQPGLSNWVFGTLVFTNCNLTLRSSSSLRFDLGGTGAGEYGRIAVHGAAALGGTCRVRLAPGYEPKHADTFQLIAANSFSGGFAVRDLPDITPASWDIDELDTAGKLVVYGPPRETILLVR